MTTPLGQKVRGRVHGGASLSYPVLASGTDSPVSPGYLVLVISSGPGWTLDTGDTELVPPVDGLYSILAQFAGEASSPATYTIGLEIGLGVAFHGHSNGDTFHTVDSISITHVALTTADRIGLVLSEIDGVASLDGAAWLISAVRIGDIP